MSLIPEVSFALASVATAACVASALLWVTAAWNSHADRQLKIQVERAQQLEINPATVVTLNRVRLPIIVLIVTVVAVVLRNYAVAAALIYFCWIAPVLLMDRMVRQRMVLLRDQMVEAVSTLANSVRASMDLAQGLRRVAEDVPEPLAGEFQRIVRDLDGGRVFRDTIRDAQARLNIDSFTLFAGAILAAEEAGGPLNQTLDNISRSLQENQRLERKLDAQTESARTVVVTLAGMPVGFLILSYLMFPEGTQLVFSTWLGQLILFGSFCLAVGGVVWSRRIIASVFG